MIFEKQLEVAAYCFIKPLQILTCNAIDIFSHGWIPVEINEAGCLKDEPVKGSHTPFACLAAPQLPCRPAHVGPGQLLHRFVFCCFELWLCLPVPPPADKSLSGLVCWMNHASEMGQAWRPEPIC